MKSLLIAAAIPWLLAINLAFPASTNSEDEKLSLVMEKLNSLSGKESNELYWGLPEDVKKKINEIRKIQARKLHRLIEEEKKRRNDLISQGTGPLWEQIWFYYRGAGRAVNKAISDVGERGAAERALEEKLNRLNQAFGASGDVHNVVIWKKYKSILESVARRYPIKSMDKESFLAVESELIDPLMKDLMEAAKSRQ